MYVRQSPLPTVRFQYSTNAPALSMNALYPPMNRPSRSIASARIYRSSSHDTSSGKRITRRSPMIWMMMNGMTPRYI